MNKLFVIVLCIFLVPITVVADSQVGKEKITVFFHYDPGSEDLANFKKHLLPVALEPDGTIYVPKLINATLEYIKEVPAFYRQLHKDYRTADKFLVGVIDLNRLHLRMTVKEFEEKAFAGGLKMPVPENLTSDGKVPPLPIVMMAPKKEGEIIFADDWLK